MTFGKIKDENGKEVELTDTNYSLYMKSQNPEVRRSAFKTLYKTYEQYQNTFASIYAGQIEVEKTCAKVRGYKSAMEAALLADDVTPEVYDNIVNSISNHLDVLFKYYRMKKRVLGLNDMHIYDIYVPLISNFERNYTYDEAVNEVLEATHIFGDEYVNILKQGYKDRWVDVYPNKGKRGGAFSGGCATTNPFILLNFQGTEYDVSTLAHESGHSMHSYFTRKNNPLQYADYRIFVAEVPSTVNELILAYYRLEHTENKLEKLSILNSLLELYKATIYRQIMFAEFEKTTHELSEKGEVLTAELLNKKYYEINEKYFGGEIILDKEISYEWMRIPHFYYNFYVYKYAIGLTGSKLNEAKEILAYELTSMVHGEEEAKKAQEGARAVFSTGSSEHMPTSEISAEDFTDDKIDIVTLLVKAELAKTRNEGRRAVEQGGVSVDGEKITDPKYAVEKAAFGEDGIVLKKGKKNFKKICVK